MPIPAEPQPSRRERRKAETRAKLLAAARALMARQGADVTRINEITDAADVGFGSFYNYFESKDAIVAAVAETVATEIGDRIDEATAAVDDAAEVVAIAHRAIVRQAIADPDMGWLMVRLELSHDLVLTSLAPYAVRDLQRGVADGRFDVDDIGAALIASGGALLGAVMAVLRDRAGADPDVRHAAAVLRFLGLPGPEAAEVASRPLPTAAV